MMKRSSILVALVTVVVVGAAGCANDSVTAPVVDTVAPAPLLDVTATLVGSSIDVTWPASSEGDVTGYKVYRSVDGVATPTATSVTTNEYTDTGVQAGSSYRYEVTAVDRAGNESSRVSSGQVTIADGVRRPGRGTHD